ncbi:hypothetical protein UJ101_02497 [Flavobacteriaceae bacterium UJ101]|nr:hypothetical protein UJ101_02497 [Flavobacteriaceae bacterium UJ101]
MKILKKFILYLTVLISNFSFSQIDLDKVPFVAYWSIGDSYDFKITKITQQWKNDTLNKDRVNAYIVNFNVIDSTENSYTIDWTYKNDILNEYNFPKELEEKLSKYDLIKIKYKTNEVGEFIEILNWKEISTMLNSMFKDLIEVEFKDSEENKRKEAIEKIKVISNILTTQEAIENLLAKEIQIFHNPLGLEYNTTPSSYEGEVPNIFDGTPIKNITHIYFEEVDSENKFCIMKSESKIDPDESKKIVINFLSKINPEDKHFTKELERSKFNIIDRNNFEYYYNPGIPHKIESSREILLKLDDTSTKKIETISIELIYNK